MAKKQPYSLVYDPLVREHLREIESKYHSLIRETVEEQLLYEPERETRNRKPLKRPVIFEADWELRFGPNNRFRAFYRVDWENQEVLVLAIGLQVKSRLFIGGEEIET